MSFFEVLTGMAFAIFADTPVDVVVLEVGVGGRLDCTNVADGVVAVITPISIDHTRLLGDTVEEIAAEKAGIIKPGATAVLAQQPLAAAEVLLRHAVEVGATVAREGVEFGVLSREQAVGGQQLALRGLRGTYEDIFLPLFGVAPGGQRGLRAGRGRGVRRGLGRERLRAAGLDPDLVREAFAKVTSPGRLEVIRRSPTIVIDAAHNPAGMAATVAAVQESFTFSHLTGVFAASGDKDVPGMLAELEPVLDEIVVTRNSSERSMDPAETAELAAEIFGEDRVQSAPRLDDAIEAAVALADEAVAETGPGSGARADHRIRHHRGRRPQAARPGRRRAAARAGGQPALPPLVHRRGTVMSGLDIPLEGKGIRQLCGTVLFMEAVVIGLAILPAIVLEHANRGLAGGIGGALAVCALLIGGVVGRPRHGLGAAGGHRAAGPGHRRGRGRARHVRPRRDLRRALGHRHLAGPPPHPPPSPSPPAPSATDGVAHPPMPRRGRPAACPIMGKLATVANRIVDRGELCVPGEGASLSEHVAVLIRPDAPGPRGRQAPGRSRSSSRNLSSRRHRLSR